jgi:predicted small lipoprotein YifL
MARISNQKTRHFIVLLTILAFILVSVGCGRKGPPKPPEDFAPEPVLNLSVEGSVSGVKLSWETPPVDPDKDEEDLKSLDGFVVERSLYSKEGDDDFDDIGRIYLKKDATDTKFSFNDPNVEPGKIYNYQVRPFNVDQVNGEPGQTLRVTYLGENSRVERIILESERIKIPKPGSN